MCYRRDRILPDQYFGRHLRAEVTHTRPHIAMGELEPGTRECIGKLIRVFMKTFGNGFVSRIYLQGKVSGQHRRRTSFSRVMRVRHATCACAISGLPLKGARGTYGQLTLEPESILEEVITLRYWGGGPCTFQTAGDGMDPITGT